MATKPIFKNWYPDRGVFGSYAAWDAHRKALDQIYDLKSQVEGMKAQMAKPKPEESTGVPKEGPGSSKETYIAGFLVKPGLPQNGQTLKYNAVTGQLEFS